MSATPQSKADPPTHVLPESASLLLDIVRFSAAIAVVITHLCLSDFNTGFADRQDLGYIAVPLFFVLSGFIIRFVTKTRENHAKHYFIDRVSRIYSVVLPAIALTLLITGACFLIDHNRFMRDWAMICIHPFARLFFNLTFTSQAWGHNIIPFLDLPFWSLGYECPYYAFYGIVLFLRGWKRIIACLLLSLIIGPQVLFLLPIWWLGCWTYDIYQKVRGTQATKWILAPTVVYLLIVSVFYAMGLHQPLRFPLALFSHLSNLPNPLTMLGFSTTRATMRAIAAGLFSAVLLLIALLAVDGISLSSKTPGLRYIRSIADGTFAIYLMHFPLLVLASFLGILRYHQPITNILTAVIICILLILAAAPIDSLKRIMRSTLNRWLKTPKQVHNPA
jgi:peptidoglycan/LPS O-acetylase OafA/YrhL